MIIRFGPWWLGFTLGNLLYAVAHASINGSGADIPWGRVLVIALIQGLVAATFVVIVQSVAQTKRRGSARVRLW